MAFLERTSYVGKFYIFKIYSEIINYFIIVYNYFKDPDVINILVASTLFLRAYVHFSKIS